MINNSNLTIPRPPQRTSKLLEKPSALKREHPALQNMKLEIFEDHFCPPGSQNQCGSVRIRFHNTANNTARKGGGNRMLQQGSVQR
jgi:hypothetical protein